jgi:hypothetical protein
MKTFLTIITFAFCVESLAQSAPQITPNNNIQRYPRGFVTTLPGPPPGVEGTSYLYEQWVIATILLSDDKLIEEIMVKLDIKNDLVEIDHNGQTKVLTFDRVKTLDLLHTNGTKEHFVNGKTLVFSGSPIDGLFSFVVDGKYNLLKLTRAKQVAPNYNVALDAGSKDFRIIQEKHYFIMKDNSIVAIDGGKKKLTDDMKKTFGKSFEEKLGKVKLNKEGSLVSFVSSINAAGI